jgi:hypothetical protein
VNQFLAAGDRCGLANNVSYGFIPDRSVKKAVEQTRKLRRQQRWAYKTDITAFFDSIPRAKIHEKIRRHVRDRSLHPLLIAATECEIAPTNNSNEKRIAEAGIRKGKGVRQGMPLSPFFANLALRDFDKVIQDAGIAMVRYADDLICFAESENDCNAIHKLASKALGKEGLTVPPIEPSSKSCIYKPDDAAEFLGLQLRPENGDYRLEISKEQTEKLRQRVVALADFERLEREGITLSTFFRRLDGQLAGFSGAYDFADNAQHLQAVLDSARSDAIERLFSTGFSIKVADLPKSKKLFLGIIASD